MGKSDKIKLTGAQESFIRENWDKIDIGTLVKLAFKDESLDGHSAESLAAKKFISTFASSEEMKEKIKTSKFKKLPELILTEEQKKTITDNYKSSSAQEITNILFDPTGTRKLGPLNQEFRVTSAYISQLEPDFIPKDERLCDDEEYRPPTNVQRLVPRVNRYIFRDLDEGKKFLNIDDIKTGEMKKLKALYNCLHGFRFIHTASSYKRSSDRELFESSFIQFMYEKAIDASPEEADQYLDLCSEMVNISQIDKMVQRLDGAIANTLDGTDESRQKLSLTMVEHLNNQRDKLNVAKVRKEKLLEKLVGSRAKRLEGKISENASILNLVTAFKQEETRVQLIELAKMEKLAEENEVNKLSSLEAVSALIAGITKQEVR